MRRHRRTTRRTRLPIHRPCGGRSIGGCCPQVTKATSSRQHRARQRCLEPQAHALVAKSPRACQSTGQWLGEPPRQPARAGSCGLARVPGLPAWFSGQTQAATRPTPPRISARPFGPQKSPGSWLLEKTTLGVRGSRVAVKSWAPVCVPLHNDVLRPQPGSHRRRSGFHSREDNSVLHGEPEFAGKLWFTVGEPDPEVRTCGVPGRESPLSADRRRRISSDRFQPQAAAT